MTLTNKMVRIPGWSVAVLAASSLIGTVSGTSMYAFYTGTNKGVQIGTQDPKTGDILVNNCNADIDGAPLFPTATPIVLPTKNKPKIGGSMAATGWWDSQHVIASVFWQSANGKLVNGFYQCDPESGTFTQQGEYVISDTANVDVKTIHPNTGLSVELLGSSAGYRVFYHDADSKVNQLSYTQSTNWNYYGIVSQDSTFSQALASIHSNTNNITILSTKTAKDVEVSRLNTDGTWHISAFPETIKGSPTNKTAPSGIAINPTVTPKFTLPAWNGKPGGLGAAVDKDFTRTAFYIGSDKKLYEIASINFVWQMQPSQPVSSWPLADDANAELAVTYNQATSEAWVYYVSNNTMIQAYRNTNGNWGKATVLPTSTGGSGGDPGSGSGSGSGDDNTNKASSGLSNGAKAGIGIGVSLGVVAVGLVGLLFFLRRRRQQRKAALAAEADKEQPPINLGQYHSPSEQALYMADGSVAPAYSPQTPYDAHDAMKKSGMPDVTMHPAMVSPLVEMEQPPTIHELPPSSFTYELPAESLEHR